MRDPNRIAPFLRRVEALWLQFPDLRFGQLVSNLAGKNQFYIEDNVILERMESYWPADANKDGAAPPQTAIEVCPICATTNGVVIIQPTAAGIPYAAPFARQCTNSWHVESAVPSDEVTK